MAKNQFIVAADAAFVNSSLGEGLKLVKNEELLTANNMFYLGQREQLEDNLAFKHPIPYTVIGKKSSDGIKILAYKRTGGDEAKLIDNVSIGFGGHVDLGDVSYSEFNVPDFKDTIRDCAYRELEEELIHADGNVIGVEQTDLGFINDNSNKVGLTHFAVVQLLVVPSKNQYTSGEPQVTIIDWYTPAELLLAHNEKAIELENWSIAVLNHLNTFGEAKMSFSDVIKSGIKSAVNDVLVLGAALHPVQAEGTITFIVDDVKQFEKAIELFKPLKATSMGIDFLEAITRSSAYGKVPFFQGEASNCPDTDGKLVLIVQ